MSRLVSRAENWERVYTSFQSINFAAFDFNTIKQSLLDYHKLYFPETFNDYIESSEQIAIIESFAYIAELIAYRLDVNAHENFISTAQRRDSILRLAKLVSYKADRPQTSRGLVKLQSVSTTEVVYDANGNNLSGKTIRWNDLSNTAWKDQFILVMNRALERPFGSVSPTERFQIEDVLFEQYSLNLTPLPLGVFTYSANVNGATVPMELVPVSYASDAGIVERRPQNNSNFTLLYGSDGLGDASNTTGFFCFTKQGTLQRLTATFDGITPNQTYDINLNNINNTDIWLNGIDPTTGETLDVKSNVPYKPSGNKSGEWVEVDIAHAQNVIFNTNPARNKYEVETLASNKARLLFGDGEFADIPSGTFNVWARTSVDEDLIISQSSVVNKTANFTYTDSYGRTQTFTFTFSLISTLQNGSAAETNEHVRVTAPSVYYTQDRMVNGADYNIFPLQDSSILKLRAINRTFAGDSKYIQWFDPTGSYDDVRTFSSDGAIYFETEVPTIAPQTTGTISTDTLISTYIQPLISSTDVLQQLSNATPPVPSSAIRTTFNASEQSQISSVLNSMVAADTVYLFYDNGVAQQWQAFLNNSAPGGTYVEPASITVLRPSASQQYVVTLLPYRLVIHSDTTAFWNNNSGQRVINYDTIRSDFDKITVLRANVGVNTTLNIPQIPATDSVFDVVGSELISAGPELGLVDVNKLHITSADVDGDLIPDTPTLDALLDPESITDPDYGYVYFNRSDVSSPWVKQPTNAATIAEYNTDPTNWKRNVGRDGLNFVWTYNTPQYYLVDPAPSNIVDMYIISKGYFTQLRRWLSDPLTEQPTLPTPLDLRTSYAYLFDNKMVSDAIVAHPGNFKLLFGPRAIPQLQASIVVIRSENKTLTDNQVKTTIVSTVQNFFNVTDWEFGETFYWSELSAQIHSDLTNEISSVQIVPLYSQNQFGDLQQVICREDEIFYADISVDQVQIVTSYNATNLRLNT